MLRGTENSLPLELWALYTTLYGRAYDDRTIRASVLLGASSANAPQRCSPAVWALWKTLHDRHGVRVHMHLMETRTQAEIGKRRGPDGLVAEMQRFGLLDDGLSAAHGIWLNAVERGQLARHNVAIVHNPGSNLMLGSGIMPLRSYQDLGAVVALGTNSANTSGRHDMFETMRLALMLPRIGSSAHETWPRPEEILTMATHNGAQVLGLAGRTGEIAADQFADLALIRSDHATTLGMRRDVAALLQHGSPETVDSVMVGGVWVMRRRQILAFDEAAVLTEAADAIAELRERTEPDRIILDRAVPALSEQFRALG